MEDEFIKTLEVFDIFVESIGRVDPDKLKQKAFQNATHLITELSDAADKKERGSSRTHSRQSRYHETSRNNILDKSKSSRSFKPIESNMKGIRSKF